MKNLARAAAATSFLLALLSPGAGRCIDVNAFFPAQGEADLALSVTAESYDEFYRGNTKVSNPMVGEVETVTTTLWARWGITDRISLIANIPYVDVDSDGLGGFADSGLQDIAALVNFKLGEIDGGSVRHVFAAAVGGRTPISDYEANAPVSLGDGTTDGLARLVYQLESGSFFFTQQVGFDARGDDAPDGFPLVSELGYTVGRTTLSAQYFLYIADGGTDIGDPGFTFPSNQDETERLGLKAYVRLQDRLGLALSGFTTLDARNSGDATGFSGGLVVRF